jgi:hypothetical protein
MWTWTRSQNIRNNNQAGNYSEEQAVTSTATTRSGDVLHDVLHKERTDSDNLLNRTDHGEVD